MTLEEYIKSPDSNAFWRMSSGEHQNLLDEAIERIKNLENHRAESGQLDTVVSLPDIAKKALQFYADEGLYLTDMRGQLVATAYQNNKLGNEARKALKLIEAG